jgi:alpha-2-macroglobulin
VVIEGRLDGIEGGEIAVLDLLPAGFEIEATLTPGEGGRGPYPWIGRLRATRVQESRDDRYVAAVQFNDRLANRAYNEDDPELADELRRRFRIGYLVRAITPGAYVVPGTSAEDMYRTSIRARTAAGRVVIQPR